METPLFQLRDFILYKILASKLQNWFDVWRKKWHLHEGRPCDRVQSPSPCPRQRARWPESTAPSPWCPDGPPRPESPCRPLHWPLFVSNHGNKWRWCQKSILKKQTKEELTYFQKDSSWKQPIKFLKFPSSFPNFNHTFSPDRKIRMNFKIEISLSGTLLMDVLLKTLQISSQNSSLKNLKFPNLISFFALETD